jgi:hypothetical protein
MAAAGWARRNQRCNSRAGWEKMVGHNGNGGGLEERPYRWSQRWTDDPPVGTTVNVGDGMVEVTSAPASGGRSLGRSWPTTIASGEARFRDLGAGENAQKGGVLLLPLVHELTGAASAPTRATSQCVTHPAQRCGNPYRKTLAGRMAQPSRDRDALPMFDRVDALPARSGDDDQSRTQRIRKLAALRGLLLVNSRRRDSVADAVHGWWLLDA